MTVKNAIALARQAIKSDLEYIEQIKKYDKENPCTCDGQFCTRISNLVMKTVWNEMALLCMIISEIQPRHRKKSKKQLE